MIPEILPQLLIQINACNPYSKEKYCKHTYIADYELSTSIKPKGEDPEVMKHSIKDCFFAEGGFCPTWTNEFITEENETFFHPNYFAFIFFLTSQVEFHKAKSAHPE